MYNADSKWTGEDLDHLIQMCVDNDSINHMASMLERSRYAIECKMGVIEQDIINAKNKTINARRTIVNTTVTVKTFVGDREASSLNTDDLLRAIEQEEAFVVRLEKMKTQSPAIVNLANKHLVNIQALLKLLEAREL